MGEPRKEGGGPIRLRKLRNQQSGAEAAPNSGAGAGAAQAQAQEEPKGGFQERPLQRLTAPLAGICEVAKCRSTASNGLAMFAHLHRHGCLHGCLGKGHNLEE